MLLVIIVLFSHLSATNGEIVSCNTNPDGDNQAAEGDTVTYTCSATYSGTHNASLVWYRRHDEQWRKLAPNPTRGSLSNTYIGTADAPKTTSLTCVLCEVIPGKEGCIWTDSTCRTTEYAVLYHVRSVATWPILYASPGEELTCSAQGNPDPEYSWMKKEDGGQWVDAGDNWKITAELSENSTSAIYKCIAKNEVKNRLHESPSAEITVIVGGSSKRGIIIGVVLGVIAVIAIIGGIVYFVAM